MIKRNIAIIGASGLVGKTIINIINEEGLIDKINIFLFVSEKSAGKYLTINNKKYYYLLLSEENIQNKKFDIVFMSAGDEISKIWAKKFSKLGAFVIDNSNAFRHNKNIPLVVPEINLSNVTKKTKIIANPNCSTIQFVIPLFSILKENKINEVVISTYQSVSGAGYEALLDLENGTNKIITESIKNNLVLKIGEIENNNFCKEENKIMFETNKILGLKIPICASTVRVPISNCHAESVYVKCKNNIDIEKIILDMKKINIIFDEISLPIKIKDDNNVHICRMRKFGNKGISFFIVADNLRRGAGYNAFKIAEYIYNNLLI